MAAEKDELVIVGKDGMFCFVKIFACIVEYCR